MQRLRNAVLLWILLAAGCETVVADCWPILIDNHNLMVWLHDSEEMQTEEAERTRASLASALRQCPTDADFFRPHSIVLGGGDLVSLLDLAVIADDAEMTQKNFRKLDASDRWKIDSDKLAYGGYYLELAAYFESPNAVLALLSEGYDPNTKNFNGMSALHAATTQSTNGLKTINVLALNGADLELVEENDLTPLVLARLNGNLRKVQCLISLGALVPDRTRMIEKSAGRNRKESVEIVDSFLYSTDRLIPDQISEICRKGVGTGGRLRTAS